MESLVEKLHAVHESLAKHSLAHAFGGAIALAYCTEEPRGTRDLDVNIFIPAGQAERAVAALPAAISSDAADLKQLRVTGQARLWWDGTPIDVFLNNHPLHDRVARGVRWVPFAGHEIPVLDCVALAIFKSLFDRTKDWADIEAMAEADPESLTAAADQLVELTGDENDAAVRRLRSAVPGSR